MPIWVADPPPPTQKRKHIIISLDDSDNDSDSNNEDHTNDEEKHITRHRQKQIKTEQKTGRIQCKKRKKTTAEVITPEHRYKAHKTRPGNSGPPSAHTTQGGNAGTRDQYTLAIDQTGCHS